MDPDSTIYVRIEAAGPIMSVRIIAVPADGEYNGIIYLDPDARLTGIGSGALLMPGVEQQ
jgi:hypothetical protein